MRISDDRYSRDRLRLDLALRFIHHEARTHTIRAGPASPTTASASSTAPIFVRPAAPRLRATAASHRGRRHSSHRSPRIRREAAVFAVSQPVRADHTAAITVDRRAQPLPTVARGALLCESLQNLRALVDDPLISFEHAVYLVGALDCGDELRVAHCRDCAGVLVTDRLALRAAICNDCATPGIPTADGSSGLKRRGTPVATRVVDLPA
jgi:hypothetical protein